MLLVTKKADIDVQSVMLCSIDGRIISNLQTVAGMSQFSFDLSLEPSGIYILRFIASDKAMTNDFQYKNYNTASSSLSLSIITERALLPSEGPTTPITSSSSIIFPALAKPILSLL